MLGIPVLGAYVGARIGEGVFCRDDEYAILRCLDESVAGAVIGGVVGLLALVAVGIALSRS